MSVLSTLGEEDKADARAARFDLVTLVFAVLALAFEDHPVNKADFVASVGYDAIGEAIKLGGLADSTNSIERLLSILYSFLVDDFSSSPLYTTFRHQLEQSSNIEAASIASRALSFLDARQESLREVGGEVAENPQVVPLILDLQRQLSVSEDSVDRGLGIVVLASMYSLAKSATRNQAAFSQAGVLHVALHRLFDDNAVAGDERDLWLALAQYLLHLGTNTEETRTLFSHVIDNWSAGGQEEVLNEAVLSMV